MAEYDFIIRSTEQDSCSTSDGAFQWRWRTYNPDHTIKNWLKFIIGEWIIRMWWRWRYFYYVMHLHAIVFMMMISVKTLKTKRNILSGMCSIKINPRRLSIVVISVGWFSQKNKLRKNVIERNEQDNKMSRLHKSHCKT